MRCNLCWYPPPQLVDKYNLPGRSMRIVWAILSCQTIAHIFHRGNEFRQSLCSFHLLRSERVPIAWCQLFVSSVRTLLGWLNTIRSISIEVTYVYQRVRPPSLSERTSLSVKLISLSHLEIQMIKGGAFWLPGLHIHSIPDRRTPREQRVCRHYSGGERNCFFFMSEQAVRTKQNRHGIKSGLSSGNECKWGRVQD